MLRSALTLTTALTILLGTAGAACAADVYKYTDDKGNVFYTDKPRELSTERLNVRAKPATPGTTPPSDDVKRLQEADAARKQATQQKAAEGEAVQSTAKDRAERCKKARDRYDAYLTSQRLYEEKTPGGERRYLTSKELDSARADAKSSMDVWCK